MQQNRAISLARTCSPTAERSWSAAIVVSIPKFPAPASVLPRAMAFSSGGSIEGYLIKIDEEYGSVVYCILEEGSLLYYNGKGGQLLGELQLTGNKVNVSLIRNDSSSIQNRFVVTSKKRSEAKKEAAASKLFPAELEQDQRLLFAASTAETQEEWATAVLNWNKHCWADASTIFSFKDESQVLRNTLRKYNVKEKPRMINQPGSGHAVPVL
ncbi:Aste57867_20636 [Aphanomyces stellatus]|uniref:Aste57867_20636 protein n=1 Tax=Aphanomyces stellatus TaxID=120398 RepID=A0A485LG45_9STRA|nr:hypothetical protein As57867_020568 [Aphanomyces stellatus]VFT97316.1 Aste57867_20636 [Aphanomyces stellatus]